MWSQSRRNKSRSRAGPKKNVIVGFSCTVDVISGFRLVIWNGFLPTDDTAAEYTTDNLEIHSNATANTVQWVIQRNRLKQWHDRDPDSITAEVNDSSRNISVRENEMRVLISIGLAHGNSSRVSTAVNCGKNRRTTNSHFPRRSSTPSHQL